MNKYPEPPPGRGIRNRDPNDKKFLVAMTIFILGYIGVVIVILLTKGFTEWSY